MFGQLTGLFEDRETQRLRKKLTGRNGKIRPGIVLGGLDGKVIRDRTMSPVLAIGPTECGKTSCIGYPTAMDWTGSMVLWSFKGTEARDIGAAREKHGPVILTSLHRKEGSRFNPLMWVRKDMLVPDCQYLARQFVKREKQGVWQNAAFHLLTGIFVYLVTSAPDSEKNFAGAYRMILKHDKCLSLMMKPGTHRAARNAARAIWDNAIQQAEDAEEKEREEKAKVAAGAKPTKGEQQDRIIDRSQGIRKSVYFTVTTLLADFEDDTLAYQTSHNDFFPSDLMAGDKPVTLIIGSNPLISKRLPHIFAILITMLVDFLTEDRDVTETGERKNFDILGMFDEFLMLHMEDVSEWIKYTREMGFRLFMLGQSLWEVEEEYGKGLTANCITVNFAPRNSTEANAIQALANERYNEIQVKSETERPGELLTASTSYSTRVEHRPLITAGEAFEMDSICYVFGLGKPYELEMLPAYEQPQWKNLYGPTKGTWGSRMDRNRWYGYSDPHQGEDHEEVIDAEFDIVSEGMVEGEKVDESRLIGRRSRVKRNLG